MAQPEFLIRGQYREADGRRPVTQREELVAHYEEIETRHPKNIGGIGFVEVKGTGKFNKRRLLVWHKNGRATVDANAEALKDVARRVRPQEAAILDDLDAQIEATAIRLRDLKQERRRALGDAFTKGNVVRLAEAIEVADAHLAKRQAAAEPAERGTR